MSDEKKVGDGSSKSGDSSGTPSMQLDAATAQMFQTIASFLKQQEAKEKKEALAMKALQAVVSKVDQFDGKNISRYLR